MAQALLYMCSLWVQAEGWWFPGEPIAWAGRGQRASWDAQAHFRPLHHPIGQSKSQDQAQRKGMGSYNLPLAEGLHDFMAKGTS